MSNLAEVLGKFLDEPSSGETLWYFAVWDVVEVDEIEASPPCEAEQFTQCWVLETCAGSRHGDGL